MWPSRSSTSPASVSNSPEGMANPVASRTSSGCSEAGSTVEPRDSTRVRAGVTVSCSSSISPTISSSTSSRVMIPAVPPCSSITTASWPAPLRSSAISSPRSRDSGTAGTGAISSATGVDARAATGRRYIDFTCTTPTMSSSPSPVTGNLEWPVREASSASSSADASAPMATISTLGTMASSACLSASRMERVRS